VSCFDFPIPAVNAIGLCLDRMAVPEYPGFSELLNLLYFHSFNWDAISGGPGFLIEVFVSKVKALKITETGNVHE